MLIPDENEKDLAEIPDNIKGKLEIKPVKWIDEVLQLALRNMPQPHGGRGRSRERAGAKPAKRPSVGQGKPVHAH